MENKLYGDNPLRQIHVKVTPEIHAQVKRIAKSQKISIHDWLTPKIVEKLRKDFIKFRKTMEKQYEP